ncbi:MAG TPA: IS1182 family transposase [Bacillota bacterium]|jgi:transposase
MNTFIPYDPKQLFLLPPDMRDWLPEGSLALFISDVVDSLDLSGIFRAYEGDGRGRPAYHPAMMVKLLLYGYCTGKASSRKIERATWEDVAFRVLATDQHPDHDSIAAFRQRHLGELRKLFLQVLKMCQAAGLVKLGHVALDGTKVKANASKHKAMSYGRMVETEARLKREIEELLRLAERTDAAEDAKFGKGRSGDELPEELRRRESRLLKIREAMAQLEAEAKGEAEDKKQEAEEKLAERERRKDKGDRPGGRPPAVPDPDLAVPKPKAQKNFTDPDSRIMKDSASKAFEQAYNAQIVVDGEAQVIVAAAVTQEANDKGQLVPMLEETAKNLGQMPGTVLADAGYFSTDAMDRGLFHGVDFYVPPDKQKHGDGLSPVTDPVPKDAPMTERMRHRLRTEHGREIYAKRKAIVEPVFGQIKEVRGFRRFSFRGLTKVTAEWDLICLTHNLLKLFRSGQRLLIASG